MIDRRRGFPVTLEILCIHAARAAGLTAVGLNPPGYFLLRIGLQGRGVLIDPLNDAALEQESLGSPPSTRGLGAEDIHALQPVSGDAEVLLCLQNILKLRAIQRAERPRAREIAGRMVLDMPKRPELWSDLAHLNEEEGALGAARKAYETDLTLTKPGTPLHNEATVGLQGLKHRLN